MEINEQFLLDRGYTSRMIMGSKVYNGKGCVFISRSNGKVNVKFVGRHYYIDTLEQLEAVELLYSLLKK